MTSDLKEIIDSLPAAVGVYIMKNNSGKPVYIGKAGNLRARVKSYFHTRSGDNRLQIPHLVDTIADIDYMVAGSDREALLLENSLIKKHKPRFNVQLKDDKTYASLKLSIKDKYPKLTFSRRIKDDGAVYFGPFASGGALKQVKRLVHKLFPIRDCSEEKFKRHWQRPCLNYNLKLCLGPCAGKVSEEEYREVAQNAVRFLSGNKKGLLRVLRNSMYSASEDMRYEDAAYYRNQIKYLENNMELDRFISSSLLDKDVIGVFQKDNKYEFLVLHSREGQVVDKSDFTVRSLNPDVANVLEEFVGRFYQEGRYLPKEILIPLEIENIEIYQEILSERKGKKVEIKVPKRGAKLKLSELARANARENYNKNNLKNKKDRKLLEDLKISLNLRKVPDSIECFDISNIQGKNSVASLVRFENGNPCKDRYRRYRIRSVTGPNDFASMNEVITRRLKRAEQDGWELPDLILIDGGKGQLNIALDVLRCLGFDDEIDVISIAKARKGEKFDKIFLPYRKDPVILKGSLNLLYLLMRVRDEAHRFAIDYHKKLRNKKAFTSSLDDIPGVGKKRKSLLMSHFKSIEAIRNADEDYLSSLPGMNSKVAEQIKKALG